MLCCFLEDSSFAHISLKADILTGFWFLLRSIEYLTEDDGIAEDDRSQHNMGRPRSLQKWETTFPMAVWGCRPVYPDPILSQEQHGDLRTRSLKEVQGSEMCAVSALKGLHAAHVKEFKIQPNPSEAVFKKSANGQDRRNEASRHAAEKSGSGLVAPLQMAVVRPLHLL